jgi:hypothetical protein
MRHKASCQAHAASGMMPQRDREIRFFKTIARQPGPDFGSSRGWSAIDRIHAMSPCRMLHRTSQWSWRLINAALIIPLLDVTLNS